MGRVLVIQGESELIDALRNELGNEGHEIDSCGEYRGHPTRQAQRGQRRPDRSSDRRWRGPGADRRAPARSARHQGHPAGSRGATPGSHRRVAGACVRVFHSVLRCPRIVDTVRSALAVTEAPDDIEVVSGLPHWLTLRVSCRLLTADRLVRFLTEFEETVPVPDRDLLMTAFREMLLNAMEHGGGFDSEKVVEVTAARTARAIVYHFQDPGMGFSASTAQVAAARGPDDIMTAALKRAELGMRPGGLGVLIARQIVDELVYNERGNEVLLIKHLTPATQP